MLKVPPPSASSVTAPETESSGAPAARCPFTGTTATKEATPPPQCPAHTGKRTWHFRKDQEAPPPITSRKGLKPLKNISLMGHGPALLAGTHDPVGFVGIVAGDAEKMGEPIGALHRAVGHHRILGASNIIGFQRLAATTNPELVHELLIGPRADDFGRAYDLKLVVARTLKQSLLTTDGAPHDTRKAAYKQMFAAPALRQYFEAIKHEAKNLVDRWEEHASRGIPIDTEKDLMELTLATQLRGLFSVVMPRDQVREMTAGIGLIMEHSQREAQPPGRANCVMHCSEHLASDRAAQRIRKILSEVVSKRRAEGKKGDLLDAFIDAKVKDTNDSPERPLTDAEIRDEIFTFLFAGHDTTGLAITNALQELAANPAIQEQVAAEAKNEALGSALDFKQVPKMTLTNAVFKEALRLHPTVPWGSREAKVDTELGGYFIPKGTTIAYSTLHMNRRVEDWGEDAEVFDPHRFLDGRPVPDDVNFNAGKTKCIGFRFAELMGAAVIAEAAGRLKFSTIDDEPPKFEHSITLVSKNPISLCVTPRNEDTKRNTGALITDPAYVDVLRQTHPAMQVDTTTVGVTTFKAPFELRQGLKPGSFSWRIGRGIAPRALMVGPPFEPYERTELAERVSDPKAWLTKLRDEARHSGEKLVALPNVRADSLCIQKWVEAGFRAVPTPPDMVLNLDGLSSIDDLRERVGSSKGGRWMRKAIEDFDAKGHTLESVDSFEGVVDEIYACYRAVADKATIPFYDYEKEYFAKIHELGDNVDLTVARDREGKISGFTIGMMNGDRYEWGRVGVSETYDRKDSVYFRLMISAAENAMLRGATEVSLGPTAYGVKAKMGAEPRNMVMLAHARRPVLRAMIDGALKRGLFDHLNDAPKEKAF